MTLRNVHKNGDCCTSDYLGEGTESGSKKVCEDMKEDSGEVGAYILINQKGSSYVLS